MRCPACGATDHTEMREADGRQTLMCPVVREVVNAMEMVDVPTPPKASVDTIWPNFHAFDWFEIAGRGRVAATKLDRDTDDFSHVLASEVIIDGDLYRCRGVERFAHRPPWHVGESIGLLVDLVARGERA